MIALSLLKPYLIRVLKKFTTNTTEYGIIHNMKFDILKWAYESKLPPAVKGGPHAVLIALAYSAHYKTEACFPSTSRLAQLTRLRETAVKSAIKVLKREGLITVVSGKGSKKSNSYKINYSKIEKKGKTSPTTKAGTQPTSQASTTKPQATPSNTGAQPSIGANDPRLSGFGDETHKPAGYDAAKALVDRWFRECSEEYYGMKLSERQITKMSTPLINALAMFTEPPRICFKDITDILSYIKDGISSWNILDETIENIRIKVYSDTIRYTRTYILKSIRDNIEHGSATHPVTLANQKKLEQEMLRYQYL